MEATARIDALPVKLSAPARRALAGAGIETLADLARHTEQQVLALHGVGPTAIPPLRQALAGAGLAFADDAEAST
jgi:DNA-directed RNA polymerase alpha subunit